MRRFSQRSHLVTLSEINITPLLDLAFVLLIIFVITTPLLENGLELELPKGGKPDHLPGKEDFRMVEINSMGEYYYQGHKTPLGNIEKALLGDHRINPNVSVILRAGKTTPWDKVFQIQDLCATHAIAVSLRSEPPQGR